MLSSWLNWLNFTGVVSGNLLKALAEIVGIFAGIVLTGISRSKSKADVAEVAKKLLLKIAKILYVTVAHVQVANFGSIQVKLKISVEGLGSNSINSSRSTKTLLISNNVMDENSFNKPNKE
ncbi:hypothetical protein Patl1_21070 [Pistacia atlantica]|uniref:Uncharacterized protein n=1 Tax=Pistacia atlantica TaxID=434234 RepID=A0ACC1BI93_9ROSI|nr:hypothetical protein Patl1_21070 [Pistacia atlantica]